MALQNNYSQDDTHVKHIKHIEESMISDIRNLEQMMHCSKLNILPTFAQLVDTGKCLISSNKLHYGIRR